MISFFKKFLITTLFLLLASCGADKLNSKSISSNSALSSGSSASCLCTSEYSPVCVKNKNFDNSCLGQCLGGGTGSEIVAGHCDCSANHLAVCGSDGLNHSECEARAMNISIVKFVSCESSEI